MSNTIAWLIPLPGNRWAAEATRMPENARRRISLSPCFDMASNDSVEEEDFFSSSDKENDTVISEDKLPRSAISLSFDYQPKSHHGFVIGTDPKTCDVVLPKVLGISRRHCHITFDSEKRLILRDTSKYGSSVRYDGRGNGVRRRGSWVLSSGFSYGFPSMVGKIVVEIRSVRFLIVANTCLAQMDSYQARVDDFLSAMAPPLRNSLLPAPLCIRRPVLIKLSVPSKDGLPPETYLWNTAKPWEPMTKAEA